MDARERSQLSLIVRHETEKCKRDFIKKRDSLYSSHAAKGRLRSGVTVKLAVRAMGENAEELLLLLSTKTKEVSTKSEAFDHLSGGISALLNGFHGELSGIVSMAGGAWKPDYQGDSIAKEADDLFAQMQQDIEEKLAILAYDFGSTNGKSNDPKNHQTTATAVRKAGRPPADWWDDLWVEMCRQIYVGDLKPKTQADIVRAMADYLAIKGIDGNDSTLKPRARKLFVMLENADAE